MVQFYADDPQPVIASVCRYLGAGLSQGEGVLVAAAAGHSDAIIRQLETQGVDVSRARRERRIVFRGAEELLARLLTHGDPEWARFESTLAALLVELRARTGAEIRVYGEMVDVLWNAGYSGAADRLEQFWNRLQAAHGFNLFCAYQIDVLGPEFQAAVLDGLLRAHTHLLPAWEDGRLDRAVERALNDVLGPRARELPEVVPMKDRPGWPALPRTEALIFWLRDHLPEHAGEILARARSLLGPPRMDTAPAEF